MPDWNRYIGIPFIERGRTFAGADCWGLVRLIYFCERGVVLPDYGDRYTSTRDESVLAIVEMESSRWQQVAEPQPFDVLAMRFSGEPWHVALSAGRRDVIHTRRGVGVCFETLNHREWMNRVDGIYRYHP